MKDLNDYEVIKDDSCERCVLNNVSTCSAVFEWITDKPCAGGYILLKKKTKWVKCTKENTGLGDIVRYKDSSMYDFIVKYIRNYDRRIIVENVETKLGSGLLYMHDFEIEV